tara:strand:+ start:5393 stop:6091 length:699 start_codon:yes stop_codon:yes gene_type:complete
MIKYIFDVDGTLTPSRGKIHNEFRTFMRKFMDSHDVYLVTGSDREKTVDQIGIMLYNRAKYVYQCNGNDVWQKDTRLHSGVLDISDSLYQDLHYELKKSKFPLRLGNHIEERPGLVNFSIVGRNCGPDSRQVYVKYDKNTDERKIIAERLREKQPQYDIQVAGETGIDITAKGANKSQILKYFKEDDIIWFFGDKTMYGGNDYEIANAVDKRNGKVFTISTWRETWNVLKTQ